MDYAAEDMPPEYRPGFVRLVEEVSAEQGGVAGHFTPGVLNRFYSAANHNLESAKKHVHKSMDWRKTYNFARAATLEKSAYEEIHKNAEIGLYGVTRDGFPIGYIKARNSYPFQALHTLGSEKVVDYQVQMFERLNNIIFPMCSERAKRNVNRLVCVVDLQNHSYFQVWFDPKLWSFMWHNATTYRTNYPEMNRETMVINTPRFFSPLWNAVAKLAVPKTLGKIRFYAPGQHLEALQAHCDLDQIPQEYGGKCPYKIEEYPNFWNEAIAQSVQEGRLTAD